MYLGVDIGGTKTLLAVFTEQGKVVEQQKISTPEDYSEFTKQMRACVDNLSTKSFKAACIAAPGKIDRAKGTVVVFGNLPWKNAPLKADLHKIVRCPVFIETDAKLAGYSEAKYIKNEFKRVLYVTISTGIGFSLTVDGVIEENIADLGAKQLYFEYEGEMIPWEDFASGSAIVRRYGHRASEINDPRIWYKLSEDFSIGLLDLIALTEPEVVLIGGGVGSHFEKFGKQLNAILKSYESPLLPIPPIRQAKHAEEAVVYGCYEYIKDHYGKTAR